MDKTAVITGASSGIGKEYAFQLAEKGYNLIINARTQSKLEVLADELQEKYSIQVDVMTGDLSDPTDLDTISKLIEDRSDLALLVNNAGFGIPKEFMKIPYEEHQFMIDVHVTAVTKLTYYAVKNFLNKQDGEGGVINVASVSAFIGSGMYSGTKRYQVSILKRLAKQLKHTDISFQALCPGFTKTPFHYTDHFEGKDVRSAYPSFLWMEPEFVVRKSLENLHKRKVVEIPSWKYKIMVFLGKLGIIRR